MASTLDCARPPDVLSADADIVGPGVLAAFFTTATVTIMAVIFAYLTNSLDESLMNDLDREIIFRARRKWRHLKRVHTNLASPTEDESESIRKARKEAITQFILALSDQQLVTGLAILIAGVSDPAHLSGYEFTVILGLAWFSSTTHLATLTALRKYMDNHGVVRDVRVVGMVVVLILLSYSLVVSVSADGSTLPMLCRFKSGSTIFWVADGVDGTGSVVAVIMVLFLLISGYFTRIQEQYFGQRLTAYFPMLLVWKLTHRSPGRATFSEHIADREADRRLEMLRRIPGSTGLKRLLLQSRYQSGTSFLYTFRGVAFSYAYGISQIILFRWYLAPALTTGSSRMGFGQIMPMLLLFLPALAAGEAYYDYRNRRLEKLPKDTGQADESPTRDGSVRTINSQASSVLIQDLVAAGERFDKDVLDIEVYFPRQIRLQITNGPKDKHTEILRRKHALLVEFDAVRQSERQIDTNPAIWLFTASLSIWIAMGVLLNAGFNTVAYVLGLILLLVSCATGIISELGYAMKAMKSQDTKTPGTGASVDGAHNEASHTAGRRDPQSQNTSSTPAYMMTNLGARRAVQPDHNEANASHDRQEAMPAVLSTAPSDGNRTNQGAR